MKNCPLRVFVTMTRDELENQLMHTKNNYILGLAAYSLYESGRVNTQLQTHVTAFGDYFITFKQVTDLLDHPRDRKIVLSEFLKMHMRTLIKESFEHIRDYCEKTRQYQTLKQEPWYQFARMIRNFLSHNCRFEFNKYDKLELPVKWRDLEITIKMNKCTLDMDFFSYVETWELFLEFEDFVLNRLE